MTDPSKLPTTSIAEAEDLLSIPLDSKTFNREMKAMKALANETIARIKKRRLAQPVKAEDNPDPGVPIESKRGYRPQAKKVRGYWDFPAGMGLNIPNNIKSMRRLKRVIPEVLRRQIDYLEGQGLSAEHQKTSLDILERQTRGKIRGCPLLIAKGVPINNPQGGVKTCLNCPLWDEDTKTGECIYDRYLRSRK